MREMEELYSINEDEQEEEEDLRKNNINESKGFREVWGFELSDFALEYSNPVKTTKVNIRKMENS